MYVIIKPAFIFQFIVAGGFGIGSGFKPTYCMVEYLVTTENHLQHPVGYVIHV